MERTSRRPGITFQQDFNQLRSGSFQNRRLLDQVRQDWAVSWGSAGVCGARGAPFVPASIEHFQLHASSKGVVVMARVRLAAYVELQVDASMQFFGLGLPQLQ